MKTKLLIILLLPLIFLTSCDKTEVIKPEPSIPVISTNDKNSENHNDGEKIICPEGTFEEEGQCITNKKFTILTNAVVNINSEYDYFEEENGLNLYQFEDDLGTDYVNIEEFIKVMGSSLPYIYFEKTDAQLDVLIQPKREIYKITFNHIENTIETDDYSNFRRITGQEKFIEFYGRNYDTKSYIQGQTYVSINLNQYHFDIGYEDEQYYIPFFLANLFFSHDSYNIVNHNREVYIIHQNEEYKYIINNKVEDFIDKKKIITDTTNYLAIWYDYFYGLDDYYFEDSSFILENNNFINQEYLSLYNKELIKFFYGLDDLHTYVSSSGYILTPTSDSDYPDGSDRELYRLAEKNYPYRQYTLGELTEYNEYYILKVDGFTLDTRSIMEGLLKNIDPTKDIYLDLTFNHGGSIQGVVDLVSFFTSEPFDIKMIINETGEELVRTVQPKNGLIIENKLIVITDTITFSGGNVFAAIVKDNNIGTVVGQNTSGGACIISSTILPNNMLITYSSNYMFTSINSGFIDDTVVPEIYFENSLDIAAIDEYLETLEE